MGFTFDSGGGFTTGGGGVGFTFGGGGCFVTGGGGGGLYEWSLAREETKVPKFKRTIKKLVN